MTGKLAGRERQASQCSDIEKSAAICRRVLSSLVSAFCVLFAAVDVSNNVEDFKFSQSHLFLQDPCLRSQEAV